MIMSKGYELNLEMTIGSNANDVFEQLQELKRLGFADESAIITFNECRVPAGCIASADDFMAVYQAIIQKNKPVIRDYAVNHIDDANHVNTFLHTCSENMNGGKGKVFGEEGFTAEEMDEIVGAAVQRIQGAENLQSSNRI